MKKDSEFRAIERQVDELYELNRNVVGRIRFRIYDYGSRLGVKSASDIPDEIAQLYSDVHLLAECVRGREKRKYSQDAHRRTSTR
jgi:hypothetical protein